MSDTAAALTIAFACDGAGRTPLTWGQRTMWQAIQWIGEDRHYFNIPHTLRVPGLEPAAVADVLRTMVERHQALRTHFFATPDGPVQEVHDRGEQSVEVRHIAAAAETAADAAAAAEEAAAELLREHAGRAFQLGEWPWRCGVVVADGRVEYLTVVLDHQTVDGAGAALVVQQLRDLLDGVPTPPGAAAWQPLDQAAYETSGEGARRGALALRYWEQKLAVVPPTMFDMPPRTPEDLPFWKIVLTSPAAAAAATRIAARTGRTTSAVLLAATCLVLARLTGHSTTVMQLIVANRFDDKRRALVSQLVADGLFVLEQESADSFDGLVEGTYRAALATYRYGFYDRAARDELIRRAAEERGTAIRLSSYFNDARFGDDWSEVPEPAGPQELRELTEHTELDVEGRWERQDSTFFVAANECPHACRLSMLVDTAYVTAAETREALLAVEAVLVAAAFEDTAPDAALDAAGLLPLPRPAVRTAG